MRPAAESRVYIGVSDALANLSVSAAGAPAGRRANEAVPECPRCGYDQSGLIRTWDDASPMDAVCSECGYRFLTRDIMNPEFVRQQRFFEHAGRRHVRSLFITTARALRPWSFWRWVRLEHWIVPGRMWPAALAGALLVHAATVVAITFTAFVWRPGIFHYRPEAIWNILLPDGSTPLWRWRTLGLTAPGAMALATALLMPATYLVLTDTLKVRRTHLLRIFAYGLVPLPLLLGVSTLVVSLLDDAVRPRLLIGLPPKRPEWLEPARGLTPATIIGAFLLVWWGLATSRYLQLRRPWTIAATLLFVSVLGGLVFVVLGSLALK